MEIEGLPSRKQDTVEEKGVPAESHMTVDDCFNVTQKKLYGSQLDTSKCLRSSPATLKTISSADRSPLSDNSQVERSEGRESADEFDAAAKSDSSWLQKADTTSGSAGEDAGACMNDSKKADTTSGSTGEDTSSSVNESKKAVTTSGSIGEDAGASMNESKKGSTGEAAGACMNESKKADTTSGSTGEAAGACMNESVVAAAALPNASIEMGSNILGNYVPSTCCGLTCTELTTHDLGFGAELESMKLRNRQWSFLKNAGHSHTHTVMFDMTKLKDASFDNKPLPPYYKKISFRTNSDNYVRLACDTDRWDTIRKRLQDLCSPDVTSYDLEEAILFCGNLNSEVYKFDVLHYFFNEDLSPEEANYLLKNLLPRIVQLAISLPDLIKAPIPLLKNGRVMKLSLTQKQISSLLANALFCTFPQQGGQFDRFPSINFHSLYASGRYASPCMRRVQKLRCLFNYMSRITQREPLGIVTLSRRCLRQTLDWSARLELMPQLLHVNSRGTIEDTTGEFLEADFANKYVGGGVLGHGMVQEEIRFLICPELIVTRLVTECLGDRDALHIKGFERFSDYTGYANNCEWVGDHKDERPIGLDRRRMSHLVAMDALNFSNWKEQFDLKNIDRELNKALVAFGDVITQCRLGQRAAVATGNWGCGAFKGDVRLKFLIQLMACSVAGRNMAYFTFGDSRLQQRLLEMHKFLLAKEVSVGGVFAALVSFAKNLESDSNGGWQYNADSAPDLFEFVQQYVLHGPTAPPPLEPSATKSDELAHVLGRRARKRNAKKRKQERHQDQQFDPVGNSCGSNKQKPTQAEVHKKSPNERPQQLHKPESEQADSDLFSHKTDQQEPTGAKKSNESEDELKSAKHRECEKNQEASNNLTDESPEDAPKARQAQRRSQSSQSSAALTGLSCAGVVKNPPPCDPKRTQKAARRRRNTEGKGKNKKKK